MKTLSYGSAVGTFVQVGFMSQVKQLANSLTAARFEALSFQIPASNSRSKHSLESTPIEGDFSPEVPLKSLR